MYNVDRTPLYSIDIFKTKVENHDKIKDFIMTKIYPDYVKKGPNDIVQNTYSDYIDGATYCHWDFLIPHYMPAIKRMLSSIGVNFNHPWTIKVKPWYVLTTETSTEFVHDHMGGSSTIQFGAVHYVVLDEDAKGTVFVNPLEKLMKAVTPTKDQTFLPPYFIAHKTCPVVEEGDFVMFPAWLDHHTPKHQNGKLRAVIAMNIMLSIPDRDGL